MAGAVEPPEEQALEALREAIRKIEAEGPPVEYPECDGGPDCQCPFHWHSRAMDRISRIRAMRCRICGRVEPHGDRLHQYQVLPDGSTKLSLGPDATGHEPMWQSQSPYLPEAYNTGPHLPVEEAALREHRRKLAEGWRPGRCTGCRLEDEPVKGPAGAELCKWCDELRILAPAPPKPPPEPELTRLQELARDMKLVLGVTMAVAGVSSAFVIAGCLLMLSGQMEIGMLVWAAGILYQFRR